VVQLRTRFGVIRPRLVPTIATIGAVIVLANLSAWQLRRHAFKNRHKPAMEAALVLGEVELDGQDVDLDALLFRAVRLRGSFAPPIMLEGGRSIDFVGGYGVLQPFETTGGLRLLVDRGELHREGMEAVLKRLGGETGIVTLTGQLRPVPDGEAKSPVPDTIDPPIWPPRGLVGIHAHVAGIAPSVYVRMGKPIASSDRPRPDPKVDPDLASGYVAVIANYSSAHYAKQWAAIGVVVMILWLWASLERPAKEGSVEPIVVGHPSEDGAGGPDDPQGDPDGTQATLLPLDPDRPPGEADHEEEPR
jgi:cytochrome oxidase assembly protein ShyY1